MELWLTFALLTVVSYGLGEGMSKEPTVRLGSARMLFLYALYNVPIYSLWFVFGGGWTTLNPLGIAFGVASAVCGAVGGALWFRAMEAGNASVVSGFTAAYPVITLAGAVLLLGESVVPLQIVSVVLLVSSVTVLGSSGRGGRTAAGRSWLPAMIVTVLLWGLWGVFEKLAIDEIGFAGNAGVYVLTATPIFLFLARRSQRGDEPWDRAGVRSAQLPLAAFAFAGVTTYLAIGMGPIGVVIPVTTAYPLVAILFRRFWMAERMTRLQTAAVAMSLVGALLVSL
ncbi:MAG TPA: EamA family transporter [Thermoplasmata archaeon]|nr:EamA family transporter [Thermoplasmata archaeon]